MSRGRCRCAAGRLGALRSRPGLSSAPAAASWLAGTPPAALAPCAPAALTAVSGTRPAPHQADRRAGDAEASGWNKRSPHDVLGVAVARQRLAHAAAKPRRQIPSRRRALRRTFCDAAVLRLMSLTICTAMARLALSAFVMLLAAPLWVPPLAPSGREAPSGSRAHHAALLSTCEGAVACGVRLAPGGRREAHAAWASGRGVASTPPQQSPHARAHGDHQ